MEKEKERNIVQLAKLANNLRSSNSYVNNKKVEISSDLETYQIFNLFES